MFEFVLGFFLYLKNIFTCWQPFTKQFPVLTILFNKFNHFISFVTTPSTICFVLEFFIPHFTCFISSAWKIFFHFYPSQIILLFEFYQLGILILSPVYSKPILSKILFFQLQDLFINFGFGFGVSLSFWCWHISQLLIIRRLQKRANFPLFLIWLLYWLCFRHPFQ